MAQEHPALFGGVQRVYGRGAAIPHLRDADRDERSDHRGGDDGAYAEVRAQARIEGA